VLKALLVLLGTVALIFLKFFRKRQRADEILSETPVIDEVRLEAERKAADKFGPRTTSTKD
jgi:hypothetical protein